MYELSFISMHVWLVLYVDQCEKLIITHMSSSLMFMMIFWCEWFNNDVNIIPACGGGGGLGENI